VSIVAIQHNSEGLATIAEKHLEKGMKVRIEGKLRNRKWEDQAGQDRYSTEVHVENYAGAINFDLKRAGDGGPVSGPPTASPGLPEPEDDIPF
jgi:single-strand DNA-binding protein